MEKMENINVTMQFNKFLEGSLSSATYVCMLACLRVSISSGM